MTTSTLKHTALLAAVPSLPSSHSLVSVVLQRVKTLLMQALESQEPFEQTYHPVPLVVTPIRFSWNSMYTPLQEGDGYR